MGCDMASVQYETKLGDMLDAVCHEYYKGRSGALEAVLSANPGIAAMGPLLPAGVILDLPDLGPVENSRLIKLWS